MATNWDMLQLDEWCYLKEEDKDFAPGFYCLFGNLDVLENDDQFGQDSFDHYLNMKLSIPSNAYKNQQLEFIHITKGLRDHYGNLFGTTRNTPILELLM